ncbi:MAG: cyclic nucleotide-binding protein [Sphingobacteriaceae bacterium]|nr:cyclic nucleotide-binding protein [Sphingobacteriaceae bacterium]
MTDKLKAHILRFATISEPDLVRVLSFFKPMEVAKKQNLLEEGRVCKANYFVVSGCLRMFFVNEKGVEQTTQFALENWWLADYTSFSSGKPSDYYIQAVERSEVLCIDQAAEEKMLQQFPAMERYFRAIHQRAHAAAQFRIRNLYRLSREEIYHDFSRQFPEFVQRIPQYLLASYLGFTPEYLSEIRAKRIS